MANFNKVILIGNITRDPELRYTPKGTAVAKIGMAINRTWTDFATGVNREEVAFIDVDAFGKQAETIGQYLKKGRPLMVEGRLKTESWTDKQSGQKRSRLGVVLETFQFLDFKREESDAPTPAARTAPKTETDTPSGPAAPETGDAPDDDVPF